MRWLNKMGFTLVELLAAVAIVGVLATLALPRYRAFIARSRSAEAKVNLATILSLERSYFYEYDKQAPGATLGQCHSSACSDTHKKNELGFRVAKCEDLRYDYSNLGGGFGADANSSKCEVYPGCTGADKVDHWIINDAGELTHSTNVITTCKQ